MHVLELYDLKWLLCLSQDWGNGSPKLLVTKLLMTNACSAHHNRAVRSLLRPGSRVHLRAKEALSFLDTSWPVFPVCYYMYTVFSAWSTSDANVDHHQSNFPMIIFITWKSRGGTPPDLWAIHVSCLYIQCIHGRKWYATLKDQLYNVFA